jgi:hypothetical protein
MLDQNGTEEATMLNLRNFTVSLGIVALFGFPAYSQQRQAQMKSDAYILISVNTYRIGKSQYAHANVSVRRESPPNAEAVELETCQITAPVQGEKKEGRRTKQTTCDATWPIESDSDNAMKDFDVEATASSQTIGELSAKETFKYAEMHAALLKAKAAAHHKFPVQIQR